MKQIKLNYEEIKKIEDKLTYFEGYVPSRLMLFVDMSKRTEFLKNNRIYEEVNKTRLDYRIMIKEAKNPVELMNNLIIRFVELNPQFKKIINSK